MSEATKATVKKTTEGEGQVETKKQAKKAEAKQEKKENIFKRGYKAVKKGMSEHPFWNSFGSAAVGAGLAVGAGYGGKKLVEKHRAKKNAVYIQQEDDTLNPNV